MAGATLGESPAFLLHDAMDFFAVDVDLVLEAQPAPCAAHATGGFVLVNLFDTGDDSFIKRTGLRLALLVVGAGAR